MASVAKRTWTHDGVKKEAWVVRYKDEMGAHRSRQFRTKKEAASHSAKVVGELEQGEHVARRQSKHLSLAFAEYLKSVEARALTGALRESTADHYRSEYKHSIPPGVADTPMIEIEPRALEIWFYHMVRSQGVTPVTAYRRLKNVSMVFQFAERRKWVRKGQNPAKEAMQIVGAPKRTVIETFQIADVRKLIAAAEDRPFRARARAHATLRLAVNLGAFCGMRWGEIFGLTTHNVDLAAGIIKIRQSVSNTVKQKGKLELPKTKAGIRQIHVPPHILTMLTEFLAAWPIINADGIILTTETGRAQTISGFRDTLWLPLQSRAGVQTKGGGPLRFHALRHFACSWMIENGWPITEVSRFLGHANVTVTLNVYAHAIGTRGTSPQAMQDLAEKLLNERVEVAQIPMLTYATDTQEIKNAEFSDA